jgi:hypothetical protein
MRWVGMRWVFPLENDYANDFKNFSIKKLSSKEEIANKNRKIAKKKWQKNQNYKIKLKKISMIKYIKNFS